MISKLMKMFFGKRVRISEEEAFFIAQKKCLQSGAQWLSPINVKLSRGTYSFWTNAGCKGNNYWIKIDGENGSILQSGISPG